MKRQFCLDFLLHENVLLSPESALTFGYYYPKILKSKHAKTVLPQENETIKDWLIDLHLSRLHIAMSSLGISVSRPELTGGWSPATMSFVSMRSSEPDFAAGWAASKVLDALPLQVRNRIDSQYREARPWRDPWLRSYQMFESLIAYAQVTTKSYAVEKLPFSLEEFHNYKAELVKAVGDVQEEAILGWWYAVMGFPPKDKTQFKKYFAAHNLWHAVDSLAEMSLWSKWGHKKVRSEDYDACRAYSKLFAGLKNRSEFAKLYRSLEVETARRRLLNELTVGRYDRPLIKLLSFHIADLADLPDDRILKLRKSTSHRLRRLLDRLHTGLETGELEKAANAKKEFGDENVDLDVCRDISAIYREYDRKVSEKLEDEVRMIERLRKGQTGLRKFQTIAGDSLVLLPIAKMGVNFASTWVGVPLKLQYGYDDIAATLVGLTSMATHVDRISRWGSALLGNLLANKLGLDFYFTIRRFPKAS